MKLVVDIIGLLGGICVGIAFIPQVIKTIKDKHADGVSGWFVMLAIFSSFSMITYSLYYWLPPVLFANGAVAINNIIISYYKIKRQCATFVTNHQISDFV